MYDLWPLQMLVGMFQLGTRTSAQVLGLYGTAGLARPQFARPCAITSTKSSHVECVTESKEGVKALERQRMVMKKLVRLDGLLLQRVCDVSEVNQLSLATFKKEKF